MLLGYGRTLSVHCRTYEIAIHIFFAVVLTRLPSGRKKTNGIYVTNVLLFSSHFIACTSKMHIEFEMSRKRKTYDMIWFSIS